MKKFNYIKLSKSKKLRYLDNYYKKNLYIVFLPGFMSDIEGKKPHAFKKYAVNYWKRRWGRYYYIVWFKGKVFLIKEKIE